MVCLKIYNHNYVEYTANHLIVTTSASDLQKLMCLQYYFTCSEPRFVVSILGDWIQNLMVKSPCPMATCCNQVRCFMYTIQLCANSIPTIYQQLCTHNYTILYLAMPYYTILYHTSEEPKWTISQQVSSSPSFSSLSSFFEDACWTIAQSSWWMLEMLPIHLGVVNLPTSSE